MIFIQTKVFLAFILLGAAAILPVAALPVTQEVSQTPDDMFAKYRYRDPDTKTGQVSKCSVIILTLSRISNTAHSA